jgi:hypothetical protein
MITIKISATICCITDHHPPRGGSGAGRRYRRRLSP